MFWVTAFSQISLLQLFFSARGLSSHSLDCVFVEQKCLSFFFFWPHRVACGILVPQPGIEPGPSAVKARSPNHWTAREFAEMFSFNEVQLISSFFHGSCLWCYI